MKGLIKAVAPIIDIIVSPLVLLGSIVLLLVRKVGVQRMGISKLIFETVGVFPIRDHYYEPLFSKKQLFNADLNDRKLPAIDLNVSEQLSLIEKFNFNDELLAIPVEKPDGQMSFYYNNPAFAPGDAEYLYNIIRHFKPSKIVEIGSGYSTLLAQKALSKNKELYNGYYPEHICIEPYEMPWLSNLDIKLMRKRVEEVDPILFQSLGKNDILFIDSSHIIRPGGDVLKEYLEILPMLNSGVIIHIHDIFTPNEYPRVWLLDEVRLWNEQYILETILSFSRDFKIIGALNYLKHSHFEKIASKCPILAKNQNGEPGSFWMIKG